ncbi:MAG: ATP-binding protein [Marinagarivorans sp.]|nr:ATP-binding protein [Marinagarivorans sp.]
MSTHDLPSHSTRLLAVYLYLRVIIGLLLLALQLTGNKTVLQNIDDINMFVWATVSYIAVCVLTTAIWPPRSLSTSLHRLVGSLLFDISIMLVLFLASGGVASGLGYLLIVYVAIAAIFFPGHLGLSFAAFASVVILGDTVYSVILQGKNEKDLFASGILGGVLFATSLAFQFLTEKIRISDSLAAAQSAYAEHLQKLAQAIITRMRTGIIVMDQDGKIELINDSALQLMDLPANHSDRPKQLQEISILANEWLSNPTTKPSKIQTLGSGNQVRISTAILDLGDNKRTVFYIEDNRALTQQAQQLKLASLGRLTASIAHEIRNPLGAISHASQLLGESTHIDTADQRLIKIILQHTQRVNQIIENTLAISRRKEVQSAPFELIEWLTQFIETYQQGNHAKVTLLTDTTELPIRADKSHLAQVLTNLCDNGARYNHKTTGDLEVVIKVGVNRNNDTAYIEVIDQGEGISDAYLGEIFNPFFTTDSQGTGLGLYISKELCEINQATLIHKKTDEGHTCFRIDFSHHLRMH